MEKILNGEKIVKKTRVFVYGSLLTGLHNHGRLEGQELEGAAKTASKYTLLDLRAFPGLHENGKDSVAGETYLVDEEGMRKLNMLEGVDESEPHRGLYRREDIQLDDGSLAVGYIYNGKSNSIVEGGDWKSFLNAGEKAV